MKHYDAIIIGGGGGLKLRPITDYGKTLAIVEKEDLGGTCLNRGCIPSKMLIHPADVMKEIRESHRYHVTAGQPQADFERIVSETTSSVSGTSKKIHDFYSSTDKFDFYHGEARFVGNKTLEVNGEKISAEKIFIATGSRPKIPTIPGLEGTPYMTSREALRNTKQPKKMIIIGGGFIAMELGHFYREMGTEVTFLVRSKVLKQLDDDVIDEFIASFDPHGDIKQGWSPVSVEYHDGQFTVEAERNDGERSTFCADSLLVAAGITPNSDSLSLGYTDINTDEKGFITVDDHLQTSVEGVYALGDVAGNFFFRHSVNFEGEYLLRTLYSDPSDEPIAYPPMPSSVFTNPQIASVGRTEKELLAAGIEYVAGINSYKDSAMGGDALKSEHGFCKLLFDKNTQKLLGAHIIGWEASTMIHMPIAYMNMNGTLDDMLRTIYIHPALPEIVRNAARKARTAFAQLNT